MTLVKDISPTGIKAMRERISAEVRLAHQYSRMAVNKIQWSHEAYRAKKTELCIRWACEAVFYQNKRDDHMDAARRCKWELEQL
jgi:hypothetical protein